MSEPFLAEVRIIGFNFAPRGWALCDGQSLPISQNQSLYSLLGTTFGGDGRTNFNLPDLRGRVPIHVGQSNGGAVHTLGRKGGEETHALSVAEMASHRHQVNGVNAPANEGEVEDHLPAISEIGNNTYNNTSGVAPVDMSQVVGNAGGGQGHDNMQPYLTLNFAIALQGLFPSRN